MVGEASYGCRIHRGRRYRELRDFQLARGAIAGLTIVTLLSACRGPGQDRAEPPVVATVVSSSASTSSLATTTLAPSTTSPPTSAAAARRCQGTRFSFSVPAGWYANLQPGGSAFASASCTIVAPAAVASRLNLVGDNTVIPDETLRAMEGGPWIRLTSGPRSVNLLAEFVRSSGSDATVTIDAAGVQLSKPVPGLSVRVVAPAPTTGKGLRLRVTYTLAADNGYNQKGSTSEVLLIQDAAGNTVGFAELNSGDLLGIPSPGITLADVARALDSIAASFEPN